MGRMLRVGSLFAGIGGLELGLESTGHYETVWQVEIDDYARKVLEKHWPDVRRHDDVCTFPTENQDWSCDVICGGFPCQDLSYAGKGAGLDGKRSGLFFELARVVREVGPKYVVLENVAALLTRGMGDVLGTMASLGYDCQWHCIPAAAVGAPHIRDRVFILGHANGGTPKGKIWNADSNHAGSFGEVSEWKDAEPCRSRGRRNTGQRNSLADADRQRQPQSQGCQQQKRRRIGDGSKEMADADSKRRRSWYAKRQNAKNVRESSRRETFRHWDVEPSVGRVANGIPRRVDRLRCLGNAVVPQVACVVGQILWEVHCGQDEPQQG